MNPILKPWNYPFCISCPVGEVFTEYHNLLCKHCISNICLPFQNLCLFTDLVHIFLKLVSCSSSLLEILCSFWILFIQYFICGSIYGLCFLGVNKLGVNNSHVTLEFWHFFYFSDCVNVGKNTLFNFLWETFEVKSPEDVSRDNGLLCNVEYNSYWTF